MGLGSLELPAASLWEPDLALVGPNSSRDSGRLGRNRARGKGCPAATYTPSVTAPHHHLSSFW